ncbi:hypothetical protein [Aeromicrobium sp. CTD01-1L150]|uniref:mechanosensitive ion channel family protein n=1 Tax=Aeromicrobium sp. CTD01-1L150 TaxID=3341830 RepID=UPI0035BF1C5F
MIVKPAAVDWQTGVEDAWSSVAAFAPKLLVFLVILLIGWIIAKAVSKTLQVVLQKVGFDKVLQRAGASELLGPTGISPLGLFGKLVYYFILLIALQLALSAFGPTNPVSQIVNDIVAFLPRVFVAVVILVIVGAIANAVRDILSASTARLSYGPLLTKIVSITIVALGVIAAVNQVGIGLSVTLPVLIAVLATVGGVIVVGVGGGLIGPMRSRWEGWLSTFEQETRAQRGQEAPAQHVDPAPPSDPGPSQI